MNEKYPLFRLIRLWSFRGCRGWVHVLAMEYYWKGFLERNFEHREKVVELYLVWIIVDGVFVVEKSWRPMGHLVEYLKIGVSYYRLAELSFGVLQKVNVVEDSRLPMQGLVLLIKLRCVEFHEYPSSKLESLSVIQHLR